MNLTLADLKVYSSPFADWQGEFLATMEELWDFSGDADELLAYLFNQVLPFVKHQYSLYDALVPVLRVLSDLLERRPDCLEPTMDFLSFVFQEPIRDSILLLVEPVQYRYLQAEQTGATPLEASLFDSVKQFYELRRSSLTNASLRIYHDFTLLDRLDPVPGGPQQVDEHLNERTPLTWLLATALARYQRHGPFIQDQSVSVTTCVDKDLVAALQGRPFDDLPLYQALKDETVASIPWAGGRLGAVAGLTLFMAAQAQGPQVAARTLQALVECCANLKQSRTDSEDSPVTTDQFLLEDLSVALFRQHLGATKPVKMNELDDQQRLLLDLLQQIYRGHTYSLLHAGVLPAGADPNEIGLNSSVYDVV